MHVKTFTGRNNKEVLEMIKAEMGSDAVILESRNKTVNGVKMVSMTVALERADNASPSRQGVALGPSQGARLQGGKAAAQPSVLDSLKDLLPGMGKAKKGPGPGAKAGDAGRAAGSGAGRGYGQAAYGRAAKGLDRPDEAESGFAQGKSAREAREEDAVRAMFAKAAAEAAYEAPPAAGASGRPWGAGQAPRPQAGQLSSQFSPQFFPQFFMDEWNSIKSHLTALMKPALKLERLGPSQRTALEYLEKEGINNQVFLELYRRLSQSGDEPALSALSAMLPAKPWGWEHWPQRVHLICGPFGSGKTSVAVRMALALKQSPEEFLPGLEGPPPRRRICLVNADCERGSGRLLLRHYAGLADCAYREAGNGVEMRSVMEELASQNFDKIIVDLPGIQQGSYLKDLVHGLGLAGNSAADLQSAAHLVLPAQLDDALLLTLLDRYQLDLPGSVVWSKLDEFGRYGCLFNLALASGLPASCLSFGPGLLNSLVPASQVLLFRLVFKHELPLAAG